MSASMTSSICKTCIDFKFQSCIQVWQPHWWVYVSWFDVVVPWGTLYVNICLELSFSDQPKPSIWSLILEQFVIFWRHLWKVEIRKIQGIYVCFHGGLSKNETEPAKFSLLFTKVLANQSSSLLIFLMSFSWLYSSLKC